MTVLIVEDDAATGDIAARFLSSAGHETASAFTAHQAMQMLARHPSRYTHMLADVHLAHSLDGFALARTVRMNWPYVRVVLTSGDVTVRERAALYGMQYLPKPWSRQELVGALARAIAYSDSMALPVL